LKKRKSEIGLESAMFNNWLTFSTSVFSDARKDFIYGDSTTDGASFGTQINAGDWTSKGAEIELKAFAIKKCKHYVVFFMLMQHLTEKLIL
jgi:hypothetical protein